LYKLIFYNNKLFKSDLFLFQIDWNDANDLKMNNENKYTYHIEEYLKKFGEEFTASVQRLVAYNVEKYEIIKIDTEVLHHASYCNNLTIYEGYSITKVFI
jgi:hypothetical protein